MAPKPKPSKRNAMLDIVVERGFHDAPMSLFAQRSGANAGVIYHYFASKEEIIQALHKPVRALKIQAFLGESSPTQDPRETFIQGGLSSYTFHRKHKREIRFYQQFEQTGFACVPDSDQEDTRVTAFASRFSSRSKGGVFNEWLAAIHEEITLGVIVRLASHPTQTLRPI